MASKVSYFHIKNSVSNQDYNEARSQNMKPTVYRLGTY